MTDLEVEKKTELISILKQLSSKVFKHDSPYDVSKKFRQYYHNISSINEFCVLDEGSWFLGPIFMGEVDEDLLSIISRLSVRVLVRPGDVSETIVVELLDQLRRFSPLFELELREVIKKISFQAPILTETKMIPAPYHGKPPRYEQPTLNHVSFRALCRVATKFPNFRFPFLSAFLVNTKYGVRNSHVTGFRPEARWNTREKFKVNRGAISRDLHSLLVGAADHLIRIFRVGELSIHLDLSDSNLRSILNKDTSAGFIYDTLYQVDPNGVHRKPKLTKKAAVETIIRNVRDIIAQKNAYFRGESGHKPSYPPVAIEVEKYEIINQMMHSAALEGEEFDAGKFNKILLKTRLFYTSGAVTYAFDRIIGDWFSKMFRFYMSAIGIKVEGGGILQLFDMLAGGQSCPLQQEWSDAIAHVLRKYGANLALIHVGEGDWSKFDFSLIFEVLATIGGMVTMPIECPVDMDPRTFESLMVEFIHRLCVKLIYMRGMDKWFFVQGTMNSGEYMTSVGDTVYQMVLFVMYLLSLRKKFKDDPVVQIILDTGMIMFFFYGDDHIGRWPKYMNDRVLYEESETTLHDYINFCVDKTGMTYKWESLKTFDYVYGVRKYVTLDTGEIVEDVYRPSVTFLRYTVANIYLDGVYLGLMNHRDTEDLVIKMGISLSATKNPRVHLCHLCSLARLSSGNIEAFFQIKALHDEIASQYGNPTKDEWDNYYSDTRRLPFSVRMVVNSGGRIYGFPNILNLHKQQRQGFENRSGFTALDHEGMPMDGCGYYKFDEVPLACEYQTVPYFDDDDYEIVHFENPYKMETEAN